MFISWAVPNSPSPAPNYVTLANKNVSSYCMISHLVKVRNLSWLVEWILFHSVSTNVKMGKKCCIPIPSLLPRISFLSDVGFSSGLGRVAQAGPQTIMIVPICLFAVLLYLKSSYCTAQTMDCTYFYILCLILLFLNKNINVEHKSLRDLWASSA